MYSCMPVFPLYDVWFWYGIMFSVLVGFLWTLRQEHRIRSSAANRVLKLLTIDSDRWDFDSRTEMTHGPTKITIDFSSISGLRINRTIVKRYYVKWRIYRRISYIRDQRLARQINRSISEYAAE